VAAAAWEPDARAGAAVGEDEVDNTTVGAPVDVAAAHAGPTGAPDHTHHDTDTY
jgi:hypothetical protein